jgi:hypothetical protein
MTKKFGRNDPCPCGSGKKYKNCHMLIDQEQASAKYTASGKRKIKAKVISLKDKSLSVFSRSATTPQAAPAPDVLEKLKFRMTSGDYRVKEGKPEEKLPFNIPTPETATETPQERERNMPKPGEDFKPTTEDFRKKKE